MRYARLERGNPDGHGGVLNHDLVPTAIGTLSREGLRVGPVETSSNRSNLDSFSTRSVSFNQRRAYKKGKPRFHGTIETLNQPEQFQSLIERLRKNKWVVYAKRPFGGPAQVLAYLGRYTHRVAISNSRLVSMDNSMVTFSWKDYRQGNTEKSDESGGRGVHQAVLAPRLARSVHANSSLRVCEQLPARRQTRTLSRPVGTHPGGRVG